MPKGELKIMHWFINNKIKYVTQKSFKDLKGIKKLYFDFYVPHFKLLIEYDGQQHFKSNNAFDEETVKKIKKYDLLKNMIY
jgi:very-short-patch-repair endonuclease